MEPFTKLTGVAMPLDRVNVDTDQIIPAVHLKRIERTGYGKFLFGPWRFDANGEPNPEFILNHPNIQKPKIPRCRAELRMRLLPGARAVGPGGLRFPMRHRTQLRRHLLQQLLPNGLLPVTLPEEQVSALMDKLKQRLGATLSVDLETQQLWSDDKELVFSFEVDPFRKRCLLDGLDEIGLTLLHEEKIGAYERQMGLSA